MNLRRAVVAEFVGTALLLATVVGSGIMGERLASGNVAIALLANTLATTGTRLCRPSEAVLDILPSPQLGLFVKEDGEVVVDANYRRV